MKYQHFIVEIKWTGQDRTSPRDFKQKFECIGTCEKTLIPLRLSPCKGKLSFKTNILSKNRTVEDRS